MIYSQEVEEMCTVAQGVHHGAAPIPEEASNGLQRNPEAASTKAIR